MLMLLQQMTVMLVLSWRVDATAVHAAAAATSAGHRLRRVGLRRNVVLGEHLGTVVQLLPLHSTILEPDLDLTLGEVQLARDLPALLPGDVGVADEFVFEQHRLVSGVWLPLLALSREICSHTHMNKQYFNERQYRK